MNSERGFTLIELLTVVAIIGILAALSINGFTVYRASAAYAVAGQTLYDARNSVEAALVDHNNLPPLIGLQSISTPGAITAAGTKQLMPGMQVPKNVSMAVSYDPTCMDSSCTEAFLSVRHCLGKEFISWMRFGDGIEMQLDHIGGAGCP